MSSARTDRRMAGGTLVPFKGREISEKKYEQLRKKATNRGKNALRKRHKRERHNVTVARRAIRTWRRRKH